MKQYFGNHLGVVINTQDPENRGRVQVYIPNISPTLYKNWNEKSENVSFKTLESNVFSQEILERLYTHLPWAEAAIPFWGGSTGAPINESTGTPTPIPTDQGFITDPDGKDGKIVSENNSRGRTAKLGDELRATIERGLAGTGVNWESRSGQGGSTVANSLHIDAKASDGVFRDAQNGQVLNPNNPKDKEKIAYALWSLTRAGIGGVGWDGSSAAGGTGNRYMDDDMFHLDIGDSGRNWGSKRNGRYGSATAAAWVVNARDGIRPQKPPISNEPPPEAYADTRTVETDALADPSGDVNGNTETIGSTSDILSEIRSIYGRDLANPEVLNTIYGLIKSEVGSLGDAGKLAFVETLFNRSYVQNDSLTDTVTNKNYFGVYRNGSYDKARQNLTKADISKYNSLIQQALQGSNVSNGSAHAGQYGDPGINRNKQGGYEAIDSTKVEIADANGNVEVFYNKTSQLNDLGVLAEVSGDASLVTNGQNVIRTRTPDQYGTLDGPRTGGTMGFNSIPYVGAKVWVFFMGGDVQVPVYFGTIYEPNNIA